MVDCLNESDLALEAIAFRGSLEGETDRGCALMAAAYLSDQLERVLRAVFVDDSRRVDRLFVATGPLGSFSARIDLCHAIGFLPDRARRDLHLIRKIRNRFGHTANPLCFDDQSIANQCMDLYHRVAYVESGGRGMFTSAALAVCGRVHALLLDATNALIPEDVVMDDEQREIAATLAEFFPAPAASGNTEEMETWMRLTRGFAAGMREPDSDPEPDA